MPDVDHWNRVNDLFAQALALADPGERAAFLDGACGSAAGLRADVDRLLEAHAAAGKFLRTDAVHAAVAAEILTTGPAPPATRIGPYYIDREIGSGGMGTVYLAHREESGLRRPVAVKVVRPGMDSEFVLRRFETERQILAGLEHSGIARLYDGGTTPDGRPYFVMEYVAGEGLLAYCESRSLGIDRRLRLFQRVCEAVQYAHQHLVIHRDLKPSNILVTSDGAPRLLDFGIATLLSPASQNEPGDRTLTVGRMMTPEYASPEQMRGDRVTTASDVYSLGAILFEMLTGRRPFALRGRTPEELARAFVAEDPPTLSSAADPGRRDRARLGGELDAIVRMALRTDAERRYPTVAELADDVGRFLGGEPVRARPDSVAYRAAKFVARHRVAVAAVTAFVIALLTGLAAALWQAQVARAERARAEQRFGEVRALANSLVFELHDAIQFLPGSTDARQLLVTRALEYVDRLAQEQPRALDLRRELAGAYFRLAEVQGNPVRANLGDVDGALVSYRKALALWEGIAADSRDPADAQRIADVQLGIGTLRRVRGDLAAAREAFAGVVATLEPLAGSPAPGGDVRRALQVAYQRLAEIASTLREPDEAARMAAKGIVHAEGLVRDYPSDTTARLGLSQMYREQSDALTLQQQYVAALARIRDSRAILERLVAEDPLNTQSNVGLLFVLFGEGRLLEYLDDLDGAIAVYRQELDAARRMSARDANDRTAALGVVVALRALGASLIQRGRSGEARSHLEEGRRIAAAAVAADPVNAFARENLAELTRLLGDAFQSSADAAARTRACALFREAREHWLALEGRNALSPDGAGSLKATEARLKQCG